MRLLWVLVLVGVAAQGEERSAGESRKACRGEKDKVLCREGFFFTATALNDVRSGGELEVLLSLEESKYPHVTFDLSLRYLGDTDLDEFPDDEQLEEATTLAREKVTLEVNELRRVTLRVSDLTWKMAFLVVKAHPTGHPQINKHNLSTRIINKAFLDVKVFLQTEKSEYARGDTVGYRVLVVDGNVDKTPKFAQVILSGVRSAEETRLPWVEVPESGIIRGNFTLVDHTDVAALVTSNVTSSDFSVAPTVTLIPRGDPHSPEFLSVRLEVERNVSLSQPRVKGRVKLTSTGGIPLEGNCNVRVEHDSTEYGTKDTRKVAEGSVAVGVAGGEFEFDVREELRALREKESEEIKVNVKAKCSDVHSGSDGDATEAIEFYRSVFRVDLLSWETLPKGNSSLPQSTVVLKFLVERRDGGSVEEEEPSKGLHVELLLSEKNFKRLRPSATNFSLPIPPNGRLRLEFQVNDTPPVHWYDRFRMEVGDAEKEASFFGSSVDLETTIHVTPIDPSQSIRRGDVVRFRVRSCLPYASINAILSSHNAIYSFQRFSFSPQGGWLDEVIELTIPQNATEGSLALTVYGCTKQQYFRSGDAAAVPVNVIPANEQQSIKIVDQVDVDMSTIVTFRLEGMLADSVVSLQAAKLDLKEGEAVEGEETERHLRCHEKGYLVQPENPEAKIRDESPDAVDPRDLDISGNFFISETSFIPPRSLTFIDVDRKTSTGDNGTLTVTKTFDRLTQFGTYVVSGATFNSKAGRNVFSNSPVLRILPPPVKLSISVPPSVLLGETVKVLGYVKNNLATRFEGHVTLQSSKEGSTQVMDELVEIEPNSFKMLKMQVTPMKIGELVVSLRSNIASRLTATRTVKVNPPTN